MENDFIGYLHYELNTRSYFGECCSHQYCFFSCHFFNVIQIKAQRRQSIKEVRPMIQFGCSDNQKKTSQNGTFSNVSNQKSSNLMWTVVMCEQIKNEKTKSSCAWANHWWKTPTETHKSKPIIRIPRKFYRNPIKIKLIDFQFG